MEITGRRDDATAERRESTAAKTVIGRDEIERFGDATLGEVLRRLPGVTVQGRPGRGGAIRMRGLGSGYTQLLLDGEPMPSRITLDTLTPEQIERIEIIRAPTAETGARAIAGTINVITRGGTTRRLNDVKVSTSVAGGRVEPGLSWTRNDSAGGFTLNHSLSLFTQNRLDETLTETRGENLASGATTLDRSSRDVSRERRVGLHASGRLQWRGERSGEGVTLTPFFLTNAGSSHGSGSLLQRVGASPPPYERYRSDTDTRYTLGRLNGLWNRRVGEASRLEARLGGGLSRWASHGVRDESGGGTPPRTVDDRVDVSERSATASAKLTQVLGGAHSVVSGVEFEGRRRTDQRTRLQDGTPQLTEFGDALEASSTRLAAYAQNEWRLTPQWSAHAGLRWEGIETRGSGGAGEAAPVNRSSVWTPLLHAVWKPDPKSRDQVRFSLTRSYRAPALADLIARPTIDARSPVPGGNTATRPDRAGNPALAPELATGLDVAFERYLPAGGILSANLFHREIRQFMRRQTTLESVSYAAEPRYVSRPQNIGRATTQGLELEAKFRLADLWAGAPRTDVRANASLYRSRVKEVPGPDNRLDQQPDGTFNLGADHRAVGVPLSFGGNLQWTPGYRTRLSEVETVRQGRRLGVDAYALWVLKPGVQLRLTLANLAAVDELTGRSFDDAGIRETSTSRAPSDPSVQLRLELKL